MEVPRGFTRCDECGGRGSFTHPGASEREWLEGLREEPCSTCRGSGLLRVPSHESCVIHQAPRAVEEDPRVCWEYDGKDDCQFTPEVAEHEGDG